MSEKWIDLGPESEMVVPGDIVTAVDGSSTDAQVPSAKCLNTMAGDLETALAAINQGTKQGWIYGYVIDESDPNPATRVSYIEDNADFDPLYMDFANDALVWGDWQDFVEEYFRPAMLTSAGVIDYYLDPDDLSKKADGVTASDVSNTSYDGNAMLIVKPIYYNIKRTAFANVEVRFSNYKQGDDWYNWTHLRSDGTYAEFCGWPLFTGTVISSKLRSLATGSVPQGNYTAQGEYSYAIANGQNWYPTTWADEMMIRLLFPLLCKSTKGQLSIGGGASGRSSLGFACGSLSNKGYFYGKSNVTSSTNYGCKFLGMENIWGERWRRCVGAIFIYGLLYVKMTPSMIDGSRCEGFKTSTTEADYKDNYIHTSAAPSGCDGKRMLVSSSDKYDATFPALSQDSSNYMSDYGSAEWVVATSGVFSVRLGGSCAGPSNGTDIFSTSMYDSPNTSVWMYGASLSYHFY